MGTLEVTLAAVRHVEARWEAELRARLDQLTKPKGSLGYLEDLAVRFGLASGTSRIKPGKKLVVVFAADHGVVAEGVSAYPREVTRQMVDNMLSGGAAINALAAHAGAEIRVVDMGVDGVIAGGIGFRGKKIRPGTDNIAAGPAMTIGEAREAVETGVEIAIEAADEGVVMLGTGEMGIGNTTASSAVVSVLLPSPPERVTGRGTGLDDAALERKIRVVKKAVAVNRDRLSDPLSVLAAVGGFEICGLCGFILGAAARRVPVVIDGFISAAGALAAYRLCPHSLGYMFFSHLSPEPGHKVLCRQLDVRPILDLGMRLGEGTGAALAMGVIEAAVKIYGGMATFDSSGVSRGSR